jgi:two-component system, OmpR family, sensor histidine kinase KdpD
MSAERRAAVGRRLRRAPLGTGRATAGWVLAVAGPPVLTVVLLQQRAILGLPTDLMFFFALVVVTAIVGGLYPALVCAVVGSSLLNYFFTDPTGGLTIDEPEQALAVVVFTVVAVAVASLVDVAERRSVQAVEARSEATALANLSRAVLGGADTPQGLVDELARRFDATTAVLVERTALVGPWTPVAWHPAHEAAPDVVAADLVTVADRVALALPGRPLQPVDLRVLEAFAAQSALVLDRARLRERADRARELEQGNAVRTALLNAASHDLRTPLAAIRTSVDGLTAGLRADDVVLAPEDEAALVDAIDSSTSRLERLIDNLLDLSMLHTGAVLPELRAVGVDEVLPLAADLGDHVRVEVAESLPLVLTDPGLLERVLANLVANAVRFAPDDTPVDVVARETPTEVEIRVVDHGPGVAPADRERMFDAFQRLGDVPASGSSRPTGGLGLGLAVARGLADAVGARLEALGTPGGGLTMVVTVPRARTADGARPPAQEVSGGP